MSDRAVQRVLIEPDPCDWRGLMGTWIGNRPSDASRFREQLGLPASGPLAMTGHQARVWHCGILAKYFALESFASHAGSAGAWVVPDQDAHANDPIDAPVRAGDGSLGRGAALTFEPDQPTIASACARPLLGRAAIRDGLKPATESVRAGIDRIGSLVEGHAEEANAAAQLSGVLEELLKPMLPLRPWLMATAISTTDLFADIVERLRTEAFKSATIYNQAVRTHPHAHVAPLHITALEEDIELPLWDIACGQPRRRARAGDDVAIERLAPRGLLMSGILRRAGSDLFIHGAGGGRYDEITEQWLGEWLGWDLAPKAVVSADVVLPIADRGASPEQASKARWLAHSARHNPGLIGEAALDERKRELVARIAKRRLAGEDPAPLFAELQSMLREFRASSAQALDETVNAADKAEQGVRDALIAQDRTWAFPLHPRESLDELASTISEAFQACAEPCGA